MKQTTIKNIVIVGGGTSGWMTAAMLSRLFNTQLNITLIESDAIGTIGVGEATIPPLQIFNSVLGIKESDFINATQATYKLGIEFENWYQQGDAYMHAFGNVGRDLGFTSFHHYWLCAQAAHNTDSNSQYNPADFWRYSINFQAAKHNKFQPIATIPNAQMSGITHAYHFDASLYATMLQQYCLQRSVKRLEGKIDNTILDSSGNIASVILQSGQTVAGDLFIDCSGFSALLIEQALGVDYENWQHWLPCDSAYAVPCESTHPLLPYTIATAHDAGWQWRIPLQHRTGNGIVYSSQYMSDAQAKQQLLDNLDGTPLAEPRKINFTTGRRVKQWHKNCIAIGLSSGFLEPLESTSLHLVQSAIIRLTKLFPHHGIQSQQVDEFNRQSQTEFEQIRDFIILHYHLNAKQTEPDNRGLWQHCRDMSIPDSLQQKIDLFSQTACVFKHQDELFTEAAWIQVMLGQGITPADFHPLAAAVEPAALQDYLGNISKVINTTVTNMPEHSAFIKAL
ncbi:tryptophan halogenase family protein [Shewanella saliphila]|uniref:Tryptophan halogenase n=1 Tax=Shewanella saliphila TaxID=2282698 RepID=A0ABQ2Q875_9GAMM|nr:tryptophan halogenase family protein [Shewanella saliphila]MCL1102811.1 tryptophan 7-halogenase [Shewanella saliphila]GGP61522.1 tryptophan halogenase [Shewanella saliphila]